MHLNAEFVEIVCFHLIFSTSETRRLSSLWGKTASTCILEPRLRLGGGDGGVDGSPRGVRLGVSLCSRVGSSGADLREGVRRRGVAAQVRLGFRV